MSHRRLALLGPQKPTPILADVLRELGVEGTCCAITAGWQEREDEVARMDDHLGRPTINLRLYKRSDRLFVDHPEMRDALVERKRKLDAVQQLYQLRLSGLLDVTRTLLVREGPDELLVPQRAEAIEMVRLVDRQHLARLAWIRGEFEATQSYADHPGVEAEREELRELLADCGALLIAGGHVLVLLNRLNVFGIVDLLPDDLPVVAWSAGAMALTERIVLFHHTPAQGHNDTQIAAPGLGLASGVIAFPHATRRLTLDRPDRVALLARRFSPMVCATLDPGGWLEWTGGGWRGHGTARRLLDSGALGEVTP